MRKIKRRQSKGFTLVEMLVVMAIILVLSLLIYPAAIQAIRQGEQSRCLNNLKQIGMAIQLYSQDWNGELPYAKRHAHQDDPQSIVASLSSYVKSSDIWICPSTEPRFKHDFKLSYVYNVTGDLIDPDQKFGAPARSIIGDGLSDTWVLIGVRSPGEPHPHFKNFANVLWLDSRVSTLKQEIW